MDQRLLQIAKCYESETNPRGTNFEDASFKELVASIKEKGVIQPVLARPRKKGSKEFEVVAGNRRFRASTLAGLTEIPALVRDMTDEEAREAQIIENLQRADIHPLEEGESYRQLIEQSKGRLDVRAVAAEVGKSKTYVYDRLILTALTPAAKKAYRNGDFTTAHASLLARLDSALQKKALNDLLGREWGDTPSSTTIPDFRQWIQEQEFLNIAEVPWNDDEAMKQALGGCVECEGKGGDLFGKKAADACTNPKCYAQRMSAYIAIKLSENPQLIKLSERFGRSDVEGALTSNKYEVVGGKRDGKRDDCDFMQKGIVVEGISKKGKILSVCFDAKCKKHGRSLTSGQHLTPEQRTERREAQRKAKAEELEAEQKENKAIVAAIERVQWPLSQKNLDTLFAFVLDMNFDLDIETIATRHGLDVPKDKDGDADHTAAVKAHFGKSNAAKSQLVITALIETAHWNRDAMYKKLTK